MDTVSSIPAAMAEISTKVIPTSQKSDPGPGENCWLLSGVYMNQPESGAMPRNRLDRMISPPKR